MQEIAVIALPKRKHLDPERREKVRATGRSMRSNFPATTPQWGDKQPRMAKPLYIVEKSNVPFQSTRRPFLCSIERGSCPPFAEKPEI